MTIQTAPRSPRSFLLLATFFPASALTLGLAACGTDLDAAGTAAAVATRAKDSAPTVLSFAADWSISQSGPVLGGGQVQVNYDLARLPQCRAWYMDFPAWDITVDWSVDGAHSQETVVTQFVDGQRVPYSPILAVAPGSDLALWFHNSDESGCSAWDSDYGNNFHFSIQNQ